MPSHENPISKRLGFGVKWERQRTPTWREELLDYAQRRFQGDLKPEHLLKLDLALNVLGGGVGRPSIEAPFHAAIYSARPDANAVVHAHNPFTVGLLSAGLIPRPITLEAEVLIGRIGVVPRLQPGSRELAAAVAERAGKGYNVILLEGHGVVGIGASLVEAEARIEALEENAIAMALSNLLGKM